MKAIILWTIFAFATCAQAIDYSASFSISSMVVDAIEIIKKQMPCGFPALGIPALAPLTIAHKEVNIDTDSLRSNGIIDNFILDGLDDFDILEMKVKPISSKVNFYVVFNNVNFDTTYDTTLFLKKFGFTIDLIGAGPAKFAVKEVHTKGTIKYSIGVISHKLKLNSLDLRTQINGGIASEIEGIFGEGIINKEFNIALQKSLQIAINKNEGTIAATIEKLTLPIINNVLDKTSIKDLVEAINGYNRTGCNPQLILS